MILPQLPNSNCIFFLENYSIKTAPLKSTMNMMKYHNILREGGSTPWNIRKEYFMWTGII